MERRFQVFVSSTYRDLIEERAEVMQALLELDCMPAGMELFPAASEEQWSWIKRVIDESDYYIAIIGGRYGSIAAHTGLSYTEMEYRYALDVDKPAITFMHENTNKLPLEKVDIDEEARDKLSDFKQLVQKRLCRFYSTPADLGAKISRSVTQLVRRSPAVGWVRADSVPTDRTNEVLALKARIEELESELTRIGRSAPNGTNELAQGSDKFTLAFVYETQIAKTNKTGSRYWVRGIEQEISLTLSWDQILTWLAPTLILGPSSGQVNRRMNEAAHAELRRQWSDSESRFDNIRIYSHVATAIMMQLRSLGIITVERQHHEDLWRLTPYGEAIIARLTAIRRKKRSVRSPRSQP